MNNERSLVGADCCRGPCGFHFQQCAGQMISLGELRSELMPYVVAQWCSVWGWVNSGSWYKFGNKLSLSYISLRYLQDNYRV